jgi:branched-chain amino acid transport system permease protein
MDWLTVFQNSLTQMIGVQAIIYCLAALGLNIQFGYTGLLNFGQAGFAAIGAYAIAVTVATLGWPLWLALFFGILGAIIFALLLGIPTLRLRADYLAIVTIAAAEIIRQVARSVSLNDYFGGSDGISGKYAADWYALNPLPVGIDTALIRFSRNDLWVVINGWTLVAVIVLITWLLVRSPWGRVLKSIREDEDAVRSLGKNVYLYKMQALTLGGVIGAFAGVIFAVAAQSVQPDNYATTLTFFAYAVLILGGAARVFGPVVGSMIFWFLLVFVGQALSNAVKAGYISSSILRPDQVGQIQFMLVGLGLMALMIFRPQGIFGDKKELALDER